MSTVYPGCIAWGITAPSGATQIGYPGYWELCVILVNIGENKVKFVKLALLLINSGKPEEIGESVWVLSILQLVKAIEFLEDLSTVMSYCMLIAKYYIYIQSI